MALGNPQEELSIFDAVDQLSSMTEIDIQGFEAKPTKIIQKVDWRDPKQIVHNQEIVKKCFRVIHHYLQRLYEQNKEQFKEPETQRGIQAIMVLAKEAAQKLDKYTQLFQAGVSRIKEYQDLQHFYLNKVMQKFQESLEKEESWKEMVKEAETGVLGAEKRGLKDLETVRRDQHYELFLIKNENGLPYFNRNLLLHIKLIGEFDEVLASLDAEDPFLRFREIQDLDVHVGAKEIVELARPHIDEFYKEAMHFKDRGFVSSINKALMALLLTANPVNLIGNVKGKSCLSYYADFHFYLREAISSPAYVRLIAFPPEPSDNFSHMMMNLAHALCCFFFLRVGDYKRAAQFIHKFIEREPVSSEGAHMWEAFLSQDEQLRTHLKSFPHGPVLKILDAFRKGEKNEGFDPIKQENYPLQLFSFFQADIHVSLLRIPSPTKQLFINQIEVVPEFIGFLRYLKEASQKHLLINLQDRTSWEESGRSTVLENLQMEDEFAGTLIVITLPKNTDFYLQAGQYQELGDAHAFQKELFQQMLTPNGGYFFPPGIERAEFEGWVPVLIAKIHAHFFNEKKLLSRKERLCFIEIFYQFFLLKLVEITHCGSMSFTCKDEVDTGAAANACFFSFLRLMTNSKAWTEEEKDFVLWMFYYFALMVRERALDSGHFNRIVTSLAALHSKLLESRKMITDEFISFYNTLDFNKIQIQKS